MMSVRNFAVQALFGGICFEVLDERSEFLPANA
jgi:hypothetical protein